VTPMRILLSSHGASMFGAERVLLALAEGLAARGHSITLEFPHDGPAVDAARALTAVHVVVSRRVRLPRNAPELLRYAARTPASVRILRSVIEQAACDVVWVNSMYNAHAALAARAAHTPAIWHVHERCLPGVAGTALRRFVHAASRAVVAPSRFVGDSFGRTHVVANALLTPLQPLPARAAAPLRIGYIGQFEPRKRAPDVVAAVAQLEHATAVLVGDGKARAAVEAAIARHQLHERVTLTGFRTDIRAALDGCSCIVIPSRNEPFGLVALEAMALGLPVIAADSGALPDVLGDAALLYPPGDVDALVQQLQRLAADSTLHSRLRERGLTRVRDFTMTRMLDGIEAVLQRVHPVAPAHVRA